MSMVAQFKKKKNVFYFEILANFFFFSWKVRWEEAGGGGIW